MRGQWAPPDRTYQELAFFYKFETIWKLWSCMRFWHLKQTKKKCPKKAKIVEMNLKCRHFDGDKCCFFLISFISFKIDQNKSSIGHIHLFFRMKIQNQSIFFVDECKMRSRLLYRNNYSIIWIYFLRCSEIKLIWNCVNNIFV